jgi:Ca-activated chloride channel family protein
MVICEVEGATVEKAQARHMRKLIHLTLGALACLVLAAPAFAQANRSTQTKQTEQDERVVVGTNLVNVNVIVTDGKGRYVKGLAREHFEIYDDRVKQQIAHFSADAAPVSLGIVCEIHPTVPERTRAILAALKQFAGTLKDRDDFFFVAFSEQGNLTTDFIPSAEQVLDHLTVVKPGGAASLYDAVYVAADRIHKARNLKKALLIVTDGQDDNSRHTYKDLRNRLRESDVQIYAIGIADPTRDQFAGYGRWVFEDITRQTGRRSFLLNSDAALGRAVLDEMSRVSGGTTYFPANESEPELAGICTQIALELRQQYTISFYSTNAASDHKWRRVKVRVNPPANQSGLTLSYREGYQVTGN